MPRSMHDLAGILHRSRPTPTHHPPASLHRSPRPFPAPQLVAVFEAAPQLKKQALALASAPEVTAYSADGALQQLIAVDLAYLGAVAVLNFGARR